MSTGAYIVRPQFSFVELYIAKIGKKRTFAIRHIYSRSLNYPQICNIFVHLRPIDTNIDFDFTLYQFKDISLDEKIQFNTVKTLFQSIDMISSIFKDKHVILYNRFYLLAICYKYFSGCVKTSGYYWSKYYTVILKHIEIISKIVSNVDKTTSGMHTSVRWFYENITREVMLQCINEFTHFTIKIEQSKSIRSPMSPINIEMKKKNLFVPIITN